MTFILDGEYVDIDNNTTEVKRKVYEADSMSAAVEMFCICEAPPSNGYWVSITIQSYDQ